MAMTGKNRIMIYGPKTMAPMLLNSERQRARPGHLDPSHRVRGDQTFPRADALRAGERILTDRSNGSRLHSVTPADGAVSPPHVCHPASRNHADGVR